MTPMSTQINPSLFQTADLSKVFITPSFEENLQTLLNGINEEKQILLISGKVGSGRKTLIKKAIHDLKNKALLVNIKQENLDYEKLINSTGKCLEKNFSSSASLEEKLTRITELLKKKSIQHVAVLFDQSAEFKRTVVENGLLLVNSSLSESCLFHLCITGQPELSDQIKKSGFPASILEDSCSLQTKPLSFNDIRSYIKLHIQHLDNQGDNIFFEEAINQIIKYSKGLPGLINRLCSLGLLTANLEEKSSVSLEMINEVLENSLFLGNEFDYTSTSPQDNSFSVEEINDDSLTFNNTTSPIPPKPKPPKPIKPIVKDEHQPLKQIKPKNQPINPNPINTNETNRIHEDPIKTKELDLDELINKNAAIISRDKKEKATEIDLDNLINTVRAEHKPVEIVQKPVRVDQKSIKVEKKETVKHKSKKRHASSKKKHAKSKTSPFFSAFSMGVIFSTLIATGLYFFLFKNQGTLLTPKTISNSDLLNVKNEYPQQLEARLNYLEQELKKRHTGEPKESTTKLSKQNTMDYVSKLPSTAAGVTRIKQDKEQTTKNLLPNGVKRKQIQELLLLAKQQLDDKKLMTPINDSALSTYNEILALAPNNKEAYSGINKIRDTYILWARHEIKKGNPKHASFLFKKALEISPGDPEILSAIITLEGKKPTQIKSTITSKEKQTISTESNDAFSKSNLFRLLDTPKGIEKLLAIAELQISRKNLTSPDRNSAFTIYKIILNRFPRHTSALKGLKIIKETYIDWAKLEIAQGNYQLAESLYRKALKIAPSDPEIVSNLDQLRKTINR